jgi:hypothetical protein
VGDAGRGVADAGGGVGDAGGGVGDARGGVGDAGGGEGDALGLGAGVGFLAWAAKPMHKNASALAIIQIVRLIPAGALALTA